MQYKIIYTLFGIAIICSMLSQLPMLIVLGIDKYMKATWFLPFLFLLLKNPYGMLPSALRPFLFSAIAFFIYCFAMQTIFNIQYIGDDCYNIFLSLFVTIVSYSFWSYCQNSEYIKFIAFILIICSLVLAIIIHQTYFAGYDIMSRQYMFQAKNSMGQILFSSILIGNMVLHKERKILKFFAIGSSIFILYLILIMKSRATFISIAYVIVFFAFSYGNKTTKRIVILLCLLFALLLFFNSELYDTFINGILFAGRDINDIDDISSGRVPRLLECIELFKKNFLFGIGNRYEDCFPLIILTQYGILGASIVFYICIYIYKSIRLKTNDTIDILAYVLFFTFMLNSLFEAQPPFGPGVKCFFLWMMVGFSLAQKNNIVVDN